jgi:CheY-like chemotaxis protein
VPPEVDVLERKQILVVEDDDAIQESLKDVLEQEGYDVTQAYDGRQALDSLERIEPSIVLLDFMMPVMDGAEFCDELRRRGATRVPIVLLTADRRPEERAHALGVCAFVRKPMSLDTLLAVIHDHAL